MNTVKSFWEDFAKMVIPNVSQIQYSEMEKAFYGGFTSALHIMLDIGDEDISEDAGVIILENLSQECVEFTERTKNG